MVDEGALAADQSLDGGGVPVGDPQSALPPAPLGAGHHLARSGRSACTIHPSSHLHSPDRAPDGAGSFLDVPNQQCNGVDARPSSSAAQPARASAPAADGGQIGARYTGEVVALGVW